MFDFKKNKTSDKVLSEQEIQQKLYGRFLTNKNSIAGASETYSRTAPKTSASGSSSSAVLSHDEAAEESRQENRSSEFVSQNRPVEKKAEIKSPAAAASVSKESAQGRNQTSDRELFKTVRSQPSSPKVSFTKTVSKIQLPHLPLKAIASALAGAAGAVIGAIIGIFSSLSRVVDFRKEGVRTGLAWGSGIVMLVLLLAAVQGLNAKREVAMKTAVPKAPKKAAVKTVPAAAKAVTAAADAQPQTGAVSLAGSNESPLTPAKQESETGTTSDAAQVSKGRFVIQVATYVVRDDAERLLQDLKKIESKAFVKGLSRASGKTYYSVFLGRFETFRDGQQALAKFKKTDFSRSFKDAFIRTLDA